MEWDEKEADQVDGPSHKRKKIQPPLVGHNSCSHAGLRQLCLVVKKKQAKKEKGQTFSFHFLLHWQSHYFDNLFLSSKFKQTKPRKPKPVCHLPTPANNDLQALKNQLASSNKSLKIEAPKYPSKTCHFPHLLSHSYVVYFFLKEKHKRGGNTLQQARTPGKAAYILGAP